MAAPTVLFATERAVSPLSPAHAYRGPDLSRPDVGEGEFDPPGKSTSFTEDLRSKFYFQEDIQRSHSPVYDGPLEQQPKKSLIDRYLLLYKGFYFLFFGAVGSLFPYLAVFYKQLFLSAQQVGFLIGVRPFIQMIAGPLWGALADTYNVRKLILLMSILAWLGTNYSISLVSQNPKSPSCIGNLSFLRLPEYGRVRPEKPGFRSDTSRVDLFGRTHEHVSHSHSLEETEEVTFPNSSSSTDSDGIRDGDSSAANGDVTNSHRQVIRGIDYTSTRKDDDVLDQYPQGINFTAGEDLLGIQRLLAADELEEEFDSLNMDDDYPWPIDAIEGPRTKEQNENGMLNKEASRIFYVLIILTVFGTVLASPAATLADTATLQNLGEKPYHYGQQRLWGAFGWGLFALIVGITVSSMQDSNLCLNPRHVDYILSFYVYAGMMALAFIMAIFFKFDPVEDRTGYSESLWEAVLMFSDCQHACFVLTLLSSGAAMGFIHTFLFWHLHDLGGTQFLFSIVAGVQCVSEVFMYFLSGYLILNIGWDSVFYIGLLANVLRLFAYAVIQQPMYSVPIEILQGVSSASIWTAAICYIGLIPGAQVTLQALLHGIYWGLGHGGGGILGGVLVTYIGSNATFIVYGIVCLINLAILVVIKYWSKIMELMGSYTYVENIPAGTYILRSSQPRSGMSSLQSR